MTSTPIAASGMGGSLTKMFTVMRREFFSRVKTKGFIIGTVLMPVFIIGLFGVQIWLATATSEEIKKVGVVDGTGDLFAGCHRERQVALEFGIVDFK